MGIDEGFDFYPPLTESDLDKRKWTDFLEEVKNRYQSDDTMVVDRMRGIEFTVGEHPRLPKYGHYFRRFSSKISGSHAKNVEEYLGEVESIAKKHFVDRIHHWSDLGDVRGERYGWNEVHAAAAAERALGDAARRGRFKVVSRSKPNS